VVLEEPLDDHFVFEPPEQRCIFRPPHAFEGTRPVSYAHGVPYRIAAPPEPELPEGEEPYAAVLRAQRRRTRVVAVLISVFLAGGIAKVARSGQQPPGKRARASTEAERIEVARSAIANARARASLSQSRFERAVRDALAQQVGPRPDLGTCPVKLPAASSLAYGRPAFPVLTVERSEIVAGSASLPSQAVAAVLADVRRAEGHLASGRFEEATLYARALDVHERFAYDVVLVADSMTHPRARSGNDYDPGAVAGRVFVYDFTRGRVVCAGDVNAKSSKSIGYNYSDRTDAPARLGVIASMSDALREDLRIQTEHAIVEAIRFAAGPI
jgi:hypothetical protein